MSLEVGEASDTASHRPTSSTTDESQDMTMAQAVHTRAAGRKSHVHIGIGCRAENGRSPTPCVLRSPAFAVGLRLITFSKGLSAHVLGRISYAHLPCEGSHTNKHLAAQGGGLRCCHAVREEREGAQTAPKQRQANDRAQVGCIHYHLCGIGTCMRFGGKVHSTSGRKPYFSPPPSPTPKCTHTLALHTKNPNNNSTRSVFTTLETYLHVSRVVDWVHAVDGEVGNGAACGSPERRQVG